MAPTSDPPPPALEYDRPAAAPHGRAVSAPVLVGFSLTCLIVWSIAYHAIVVVATNVGAGAGLRMPWAACVAGYFAGGIGLPYVLSAGLSRPWRGRGWFLLCLAVWSVVFFLACIAGLRHAWATGGWWALARATPDAVA